MNITHVIRGDDHKINTFKQKQIYEAMEWKIPNFAHIPLIHSESGSKLSKRDKASTINDYIKLGIISDALRNYLLRLGWSHKDKEIFTLEESIKLFNLKDIGKSPSRLDMTRILSINEHYIKHIDESELFKLFKIYCKNFKESFEDSKDETLFKSMKFLKNKAKTLEDIYQNSQYILSNNIKISSTDLKLIDKEAKKVIKDFLSEYQKISKVNKGNLEKIVNNLIEKYKTSFKGVGQPLRIALTGSKFGPGIYDIILSLKKDVIIKRLQAIN